ncbi:MAG: hypothetical protein HKN04_13190 [Rhodothermaceae bacterium]|nr:hypothetical protein [Rhodothermaceae bacterium]
MALLVVLLVGLFAFLTRTQIGRNTVRTQVVAAFNREYAGRLEIGRVTGNLVNDLFVSGARLYDPDGRLVVSADSVILKPRWRSLLRRAFVADEVVLFRPRLDLMRDSAGLWNLTEALRPRRPSTAEPNPLDLSTTDLRLVDGRITTSNTGPLPDAVQAGRLFDYTNASLADLDASLVLDWRRDVKLLGVELLTATLPQQNVTIETLAGRLTLADEGVNVDGLRLVTTGSRLEGDVALTRTAEDSELTLDLRQGQLAATDVRAFLPGVPLGDQVRGSGQLRGPLNDLRATSLRLSRGQTAVQVDGRLSGLPDSLVFDVTIPSSTVRAADLQAVWPALALPPEMARLGLASLEGDLAGSIQPGGRIRLEGEAAVATDAGDAEGYIQLAASPGRPLRLVLDADTENLNPAALTGDDRLAGRLTGQLVLERPALGREATDTAFRLALTDASFAGRTADSLRIDGTQTGNQIEARVALRQGGSTLRGRVDTDTEARSLQFEGELAAFDLRQLFPGAPATRFTGPLRAALRGSDLATLSADVEANFSEAAVEIEGAAMQRLPTGPLALTIQPPSEPGPRVRFASPVAEGELDGGVGLDAVVALSRQWGMALAAAAQTAYDKPLRGSPPTRTPLPEPTFRRALEPFALTLTIRRPDDLRAFVPALPELAPGTTLQLDGTLGSDALEASFGLTTDALTVGTTRLHGLALNGRLDTPYQSDLLRALALDLTAQADSMRVEGRLLATPSVALDLAQRRLAFTADAMTSEDATVHLVGALDLLADRNRLTLTETLLDAAGFRWTTPGPQIADLYRDVIVLPGLTFLRADDEAAQRIAFRGRISTSTADTLYADVEGVDLREVATAQNLAWRGAYLGGALDASLAIVNVLRRPELSGRAIVPHLLLGDRLLGRLDATSRFVPGGEAVAVDLRLERPHATPPVPDSLRVEENELRVAGRVRFPGRNDDGTRDSGLLGLTLAVDRADLFFLDLLFPSVVRQAEGAARGFGQITGDFSTPLFQANLIADEVAATIPRFGLALGGDGRVQVDQRGIHLHDVALTDKAGGTAHIDGSILFNDYRFFSLDLQATLDAVEVVDVPTGDSGLPFYGYIRASGTASVTGPLNRVFLRSTDAVTTTDSEIFIPIAPDAIEADQGFIVFADSLGRVPERRTRTNIIGPRPESERSFTQGLEMNLNVTAPPGSTVHLVFDPVIGEVLTADGRAELQLAIREGRFRTFGTFTAAGGDYPFTAGDVFTRRFEIEPGGTLIWDGDPLDARMNLDASYRTRASLAGLGLTGLESQRVPLRIRASVGGRLSGPLIALALDLDTDARGTTNTAAIEALRPLLNDTDRQALYATSVLLTGTFLLAPVENAASGGDVLTGAADDLLYTSLSQLVASRLNRFLNQALASDNVEVLLGLQPGEQFQDFDLTYGVALRLLDERLVIRGEGLYQQLENRPTDAGLQGEVAIEVRLTPAVSLEVFYRRESELLGGTTVGTTPYGAYGAGLSYEAQFTSWHRVLRRLLGQEPEPAAGG